MREQWLAVEHHRLHAIEEWPDGPRKQAALASIHSKLESLSQGLLPSTECTVCQDRSGKLVKFPHSLPSAIAAIDAAA